MEVLNDDLLLLVFERLSLADRIQLEVVCPKWQTLLWKTWKSVKELDVDRHFAKWTSERNCWRKREATLAALNRCARNLEHLTLGCDPTVETVRTFARKASLYLSVVEKIVSDCRKLKSLTLVRYDIGSLGILRRFIDLPDTLEELRFRHCRLDANSEWEGSRAKDILCQLFAKFHRLTSFSLIGRGTCYGHLEVDEMLAANLPPSLERLNLSAGQFQKIHQLEFLRRLPQLQALSLERSKIVDVRRFADYCPNISTLNLAYNRLITDFKPLGRLTQLRVLILDGNRDYMTDTGLAAICQNCALLEELSLECCAAVTEGGLREIAQLRRLQRLNTSALSHVTDSILLEIALKCSYLTQLKVNYCKQISATGLIDATKHLPKLCQLELCGHQFVTNDVLCEVRKFCIDLKKLHVYCCAKLNFKTLVICLPCIEIVY